ncbi:Uncharacterised protein [uncultured archaeon]|nr:Uncharacterised protein [uncultured archaeon]
METQLVYNIISWLGFGLILLSFVLLSFRKIKAKKIFNILNFFGAAGIAVASVYKQDWILFALSIAWVLTSLTILVLLFTPNKEYKDWTY